MRLLGFAIRTSDENPAYTYDSLDSIFNGLVNNYLPSGESLSARVNTTALEKWRAKHFGFLDEVDDSLNNADPEGDGISNLLEFAFGGDPLGHNDSNLQPQLLLRQDGSNQYEFNYLRRNDGGLNYDIETSTNLTDWELYVPEFESVIALDSEFDEVFVEPDTADTSQLFIRIQISEAVSYTHLTLPTIYSV